METGGLAAVVLAGGTAVRLGGADKATVELGGRTLLEHALAALGDAEEVVVVGDPVATSRPVGFTREDPPYGGPVAGLLSGRDALRSAPRRLLVVAVDMPMLETATVRRLQDRAAGHDGAVLTDPDGRRQLALLVDVARLDAVRPAPDDVAHHPLHRLLARLDLADVAPVGREHRDVDTWDDLSELSGPP